MQSNGLIGMVLAACLAGCASTSGTRSEPQAGVTPAPAHGSKMGMAGKCPMEVPNTTVTAPDVEGGVALAFTTGTGDVAEVRQRVRGMARMHDRHHAAGGKMKGGMMKGGMMKGGKMKGGKMKGGMMKGGMMKGGTMMPAATAAVEDIEGGARLVLRPKDPAQLDALRQHARMHAQRMAGGKCPMMSDGAKGQATPPPSAGVKADHEAHHSSARQ